MREIIPIQQTNDKTVANYLIIEAIPVTENIYFKWILYNWNQIGEPIYVNNGSICITYPVTEEYNNDEDWMYNYVAKELGLTFI